MSSVCVFMYVYIYVCGGGVYVCMYVCMRAGVCVCVYVRMYDCVRVCLHCA